jgi:phosphoserine phosphatase
MVDDKYELIINHSREKGFESISLDRKDYLKEVSYLLKEPKKVFIGLGDFLEIGDYSTLIDNIFFDTEGIKIENILDDNNRRLSSEGEVPFSFFKLAVYFPDFLLKEVPTSCISVIGEKSRLFPGAETFIRFIRTYDPLVLTAMPQEIAIEFVKRVGLNDNNLIATDYKKKQDKINKEVYAGDVNRFISGDRKSLIIEKYLHENNLRNDEVVYMGRGEAGVKTFYQVNSVAFNPFDNIIPQSKITLYGSSLLSLLVLFNFNGAFNDFLLSDQFEEFMPSLVVYSSAREKSQELIDIEIQHRNMQNNVIGQRIEHSGVSYKSVEREIEVVFAGSSININHVKQMVTERMEEYRKNPGDLVRKTYDIAKLRYKSFCTNGNSIKQTQ